MNNNVNDVKIKKREDIFDTLILQAKMKRVVYFLFLALLIVVAYENREPIINLLSFKAEALEANTNRIKLLNINKFKALSEKIVELSNEYQIYESSFVKLDKEIKSLIEIPKQKKSAKLRLASQKKVLKRVWLLINSPYLEETKKISSLKKYVAKLMKQIKIKPTYEMPINTIKFEKRVPKVLSEPTRNIFEFTDNFHDKPANKVINNFEPLKKIIPETSQNKVAITASGALEIGN